MHADVCLMAGNRLNRPGGGDRLAVTPRLRDMSYEARLVFGLPETGKGYPTLDSQGNLTLPGHSESIPPRKWRWVRVESEATPDLSGAGKGAVSVSAPPGANPTMPERPSTRRR